MSSISKRSAASRKAWRTRKKMKASRAVTLTFDNGQPVTAGELLVDPERGIIRSRTANVLLNPFMEIK